MEAAIRAVNAGVRFRVSRLSQGGRKKILTRGLWATTWGVRGIDLTVHPGEVIGLIGPNGAGKTTLLRAIAGIYSVNEGSLERNGTVASMLTPAAGLSAQLSGWENIKLVAVLMGASRAELDELVPKIAEFSGVGEWLDAPVRTYSSGMKARLGFSAAVHVNPDILVLDEVMAVGDQDFRERSSAAIQEHIGSGRTVVLASHNVIELAEVCDRLVRLKTGSIVDQGDPDRVIEGYIAEHGRPAQKIGRNLARITPKREERADES